MLLQEDLNTLSDWCETNKLTVNTEKTKVLCSYSMNGGQLKIVTDFNYLGVLLDSHLSPSAQMKKVINLAQVRPTQLHRIRAISDRVQHCRSTHTWWGIYLINMHFSTAVVQYGHGAKSKPFRTMVSVHVKTSGTHVEWMWTCFMSIWTSPKLTLLRFNSSYLCFTRN